MRTDLMKTSGTNYPEQRSHKGNTRHSETWKKSM